MTSNPAWMFEEWPNARICYMNVQLVIAVWMEGSSLSKDALVWPSHFTERLVSTQDWSTWLWIPWQGEYLHRHSYLKAQSHISKTTKKSASFQRQDANEGLKLKCQWHVSALRIPRGNKRKDNLMTFRWTMECRVLCSFRHRRGFAYNSTHQLRT